MASYDKSRTHLPGAAFWFAVENRDFMGYNFFIFDSLFSFVRTPYMICKIFSKAFL